MLLAGEGGRLCMPVFDGDYAYGDAGKFNRSYADLPSVIKTEAYRNACWPFVLNVKRLVAFHQLPLQFAIDVYIRKSGSRMPGRSV